MIDRQWSPAEDYGYVDYISMMRYDRSVCKSLQKWAINFARSVWHWSSYQMRLSLDIAVSLGTTTTTTTK